MTESIPRHTLIVRLCHALAAASALLLCFSGIGFMPLYGRFFLNTLPGLAWVTDFGFQMKLHYLAAIVFMAACFFHLCFHLMRRELAAWPKRGDMKESLEIILSMVKGKEEPPHGKFLAEQRVAYAAIALVSLVLILTGLFLSYKSRVQVIFDPLLLQAVTLLHMATTFAFMALVAMHLLAFALKANRPLLPSMFTGKVPRRYARKRHPKWRIKG